MKRQHVRATRNADSVIIYALIDEEHLDPEQAGVTEILFDGVEADSFDRAPANFEMAAQTQWEPENWLITTTREIAAQLGVRGGVDSGWYRITLDFSGAAGSNARSYIVNEGDGQELQVASIDRTISRSVKAKLDRYSALYGAREASQEDIAAALDRCVRPSMESMVVAYDVGQANWNAFVDCSGCPHTAPVTTLFFDCGMPVGRLSKTAPAPYINPFAAALDDAPVVLSHWDTDHWAGAALGQPLHGNRGIRINWRPEALSRKWIVPNQGTKASSQKIPPMGWRLALALRRQGNLLIWPKTLPFLVTGAGHVIVRCVPTTGTLKNNNNSGLAWIAPTGNAHGWGGYVLAAGDADYATIRVNFPYLDKLPFCGLVGAHHGAAIVSTPPAPMAGWQKMVFSHGAHHGHPTAIAHTMHTNAGWKYHYETHTRVVRSLATASQTIGTTSLGASLVAVKAKTRGACLRCATAVQTCPVK